MPFHIFLNVVITFLFLIIFGVILVGMHRLYTNYRGYFYNPYQQWLSWVYKQGYIQYITEWGYKINKKHLSKEWQCSLWRTVWRFLKKLEIELPYNPTIPLLGIHTEESRIERHVYPNVHCNTVYNSQDMKAI